jgi:hypothetical protein
MARTSKSVEVSVNASFSALSEDGYSLWTLREAIKRWGREFVADRLRELAEQVEDGHEVEDQDAI